MRKPSKYLKPVVKKEFPHSAEECLANLDNASNEIVSMLLRSIVGSATTKPSNSTGLDTEN